MKMKKSMLQGNIITIGEPVDCRPAFTWKGEKFVYIRENDEYVISHYASGIKAFSDSRLNEARVSAKKCLERETPTVEALWERIASLREGKKLIINS